MDAAGSARVPPMNTNAASVEALRERLARVRERIARAAERAGRSPDSVRLVAVTKTHPAEAIAELLAAGCDTIGENRVQEFLAKTDALRALGVDPSRLRTRFVGHLQRNKADKIVRRVESIDSVDSTRLVEAIERRAAEWNAVQPILVELNVGMEPNKTGADPGDLPAILDAAERSPHVRVEGLMTVPPYDPDPETARPHFRRLREIRDAWNAERGETERVALRELSMGMSGDFEIAIEEGATMVRVGSALMGERA